MKKATRKSNRLVLQKMTITELNTQLQSYILGGEEPAQSYTIRASQGNCMTMSDDCPGPPLQDQQPVLLP